MIDELCELIQGEDGLLVELRMELMFNDKKYQRIVELLNLLIGEWSEVDTIPKKALIAIVDLLNCLVGNNRFLSEEESLKVENASIEIYDMLMTLCDTV